MSTGDDDRHADPYFRDLGVDAPMPVPTALTGAEDAPGPGESTDYALAPMANPFLRPALWLALLVLAVLMGWELAAALQALAALHWSLGTGFALLLAGAAVLLGFAALRLLGAGRELRRLGELRRQAGLLIRERGFGGSADWLQALRAHYAGKPQERLLVAQLAALPDYDNDAELLQRLSDGFAATLDRQAHRAIWRYSRETALLVGLSPLASLDVALALWRSLRMIDQIGQVYGVRPSLLGRWRLVRLVAHQLAFVGLSELAGDALAQFGAGAVYASASTRVGQGLGAGLYSARIGLAAIEICRPLPGRQDRQRLLVRLGASIAESLQQQPPRR